MPQMWISLHRSCYIQASQGEQFDDGTLVTTDLVCPGNEMILLDDKVEAAVSANAMNAFIAAWKPR